MVSVLVIAVPWNAGLLFLVITGQSMFKLDVVPKSLGNRRRASVLSSTSFSADQHRLLAGDLYSYAVLAWSRASRIISQACDLLSA